MSTPDLLRKLQTTFRIWITSDKHFERLDYRHVMLWYHKQLSIPALISKPLAWMMRRRRRTMKTAESIAVTPVLPATSSDLDILVIWCSSPSNLLFADSLEALMMSGQRSLQHQDKRFPAFSFYLSGRLLISSKRGSWLPFLVLLLSTLVTLNFG